MAGEDLWGFESRGWTQVWLRGPEAPSLIGGSEDVELVHREHTRAWGERGAVEGWGRCEDKLVCSDERPEVKLSGVARQGGRRSRS